MIDWRASRPIASENHSSTTRELSPVMKKNANQPVVPYGGGPSLTRVRSDGRIHFAKAD